MFVTTKFYFKTKLLNFVLNPNGTCFWNVLFICLLVLFNYWFYVYIFFNSFSDGELCVSVKIVTVWVEVLFYRYQFAVIQRFDCVVIQSKIKWSFRLSNTLLLAGCAVQYINNIFTSATWFMGNFLSLFSCETSE